MRSSHLTLRAPMYPGTTTRSGAPCTAASGWPFIAQASSTSDRRALSSGIDPPNSCTGTASGHESAPSNPTSDAVRSGPASRSTSASATPVQVAVPVAPGPHGDSLGISRIAISPARRLPAH